MIYFTWVIILILFIFSFFVDSVSVLIPIIIYLLIVIFKAKEKIGNYKDWQKINKNSEHKELSKINNPEVSFIAKIFLKHSVTEKYDYERKKKKRRFENEIIDALLLK